MSNDSFKIAPFTRQSLIVSLEISDTSRGPTPEVIKIREDLGSKYHFPVVLATFREQLYRANAFRISINIANTSHH